MVATGVFSSCVTAATKSDFIDASAALARSARTVRTSASRLAPAAIEIRKNIRRAPWSVARSASSGSDLTCTVHSRTRVGRVPRLPLGTSRAYPGDEIDFTSAGSMKRSGNRVCSSPAPSCSIGAAGVTTRLSSSDTVIERPPSPPPIFATCSTSGSKYCARSDCSLTVKAMNPRSACDGPDANSACATI